MDRRKYARHPDLTVVLECVRAVQDKLARVAIPSSEQLPRIEQHMREHAGSEEALVLHVSGDYTSITFHGVLIWDDNEADCRDFDDEDNATEPLDEHIETRIKNFALYLSVMTEGLK